MKIGILGNKGFIGGHLADYYINNSDTVIGVDNNSTGNYINPLVVQIDTDLRNNDAETFNPLLDCDIIVHLASTARVQPSYNNPEPYFSNNIGNLTNILNILHLNNWKGRFIYVSTSSVYGGLKYKSSKFNYEFDNLNPKSPYGLSKKLAEDVCMYYYTKHFMDIRIVRPFNVYGERMSTNTGYSTLLSILLEKYKQKQPLPLCGDGKQSRDFTHVDDVCSAINLIAKTKNHERIFNIGSGRSYTINQILEAFPMNCKIEKLPPTHDEIQKTCASIILLSSIGYKPTKNVIEWLQTKI